MSQVRIPPPPSFGSKRCNFKPDDSTAECHAKRTGETIAAKKAEGKMDQQKGEIESKDTVDSKHY